MQRIVLETVLVDQYGTNILYDVDTYKLFRFYFNNLSLYLITTKNKKAVHLGWTASS
jgi:hypothetical protein